MSRTIIIIYDHNKPTDTVYTKKKFVQWKYEIMASQQDQSYFLTRHHWQTQQLYVPFNTVSVLSAFLAEKRVDPHSCSYFCVRANKK
jgi:hypothetical protein